MDLPVYSTIWRLTNWTSPTAVRSATRPGMLSTTRRVASSAEDSTTFIAQGSMRLARRSARREGGACQHRVAHRDSRCLGSLRPNKGHLKTQRYKGIVDTFV